MVPNLRRETGSQFKPVGPREEQRVVPGDGDSDGDGDDAGDGDGDGDGENDGDGDGQAVVAAAEGAVLGGEVVCLRHHKSRI